MSDVAGESKLKLQLKRCNAPTKVMAGADQGGHCDFREKGESAAIGLGGRTFLLVMHRRRGRDFDVAAAASK